MRGRLLFLLLLLSIPLGETQGAVRDPGSYFFDQTLGNFQEELQLARDEGKTGVLIMFEMDECPFCHRMKTQVLNQSEVQDYFKTHFLIFTVDIEGDVEITDFKGRLMKEKVFAFKQHKVRATPVFGFFDLEGNMITRFTGTTNDAQEFLWLGEFVVEGHYKTTNFIRYKRQKKQGQ